MRMPISNLFALPADGLAVFHRSTGPWGRPDIGDVAVRPMPSCRRPIKLVNHGRNAAAIFTYVDDVVEAVVRMVPNPPTPDSAVVQGTLPIQPRAGPLGRLQ